MSNFEPLSWELQFTLKNQGSDLKAADSLLQKLRVDLEKTNQALIRMQKLSVQAFSSMHGAIQKQSFGALGGGGKGGLLQGNGGGANAARGISAIGTAAIVAAGGVALLGYGIKKIYDGIDDITDKAIEAFSERQSSLRAYTTILGSATQAEKEYYKSASLAQKTELTNQQTLGIQNRLITAGFRGEKLDRALLNVADVVTLRPQHLRESSVNQLSELYSKVQGLGYIQEGLLNRTASRFVSGKVLREEIGKQLGIKTEDVQAALKNRKVTSEAFFNAFQSATLRQAGTKKVGEYATGASGNLATLISNQQEALQNLFRSIDPQRLAGVSLYKRSIEDLTEAMSFSTESGKNLRYVLEDVSNVGTSLKGVFNEFSTGFLESFSSSFRKTMNAIGLTSDDSKKSMMKFAEQMKSFGKTLGDFLGPILAYTINEINSLGETLGILGHAWMDFKNDLSSIGEKIKSFANVVVEAFGKIFDYIGRFLNPLDEFVATRSGYKGGGVARRNSANQKGTEQAFRRSRGYNSLHPELGSLEGGKRLAGETDLSEIGGELSGGGRGGRGSGRGGGTQIEPGVLFSFNYAKALPAQIFGSLGSGTSFRSPMNFTPPSLRQNEPSKTSVHVNSLRVDIHIEGANHSPEQIARQVSLELSQTLGRLSRSPSAGVI